MDSLKTFLLLQMLLAVKTLKEDGMVQREHLSTEFQPQMAVGFSFTEHDMLQRELSLTDLLKHGFLVSPPTVTPKDHYIKQPPLELFTTFPLARPNTDNILAICHYSNQRPRYTQDMLPKNGFGYVHRQAAAVNRLESWFAVCCGSGTEDEELTLCCAQQAWEKSLSDFCEEEFSIKTSHYYCCKQNGQARWDCFQKAAPEPSYQPSGAEGPPSTIQGFGFNSSSCQETSVSETNPRQEMVTDPSNPSKIRPRTFPQYPGVLGERGYHVSHPRPMRSSITFPLAPPTNTNIPAICQYSKQRPWHPEGTLLQTSPVHLYRQASAINQLESWYSVCCASGSQDDKLTLCCAKQAWVKSLNAFCRRELFSNMAYHCCREEGPAKWDCFKKEASDTSYLPSTIQGFDFDSSSCQKKSISAVVPRALTERKRRIKVADIGFPPGRPNFINIGPVCAFRKYRPRYLKNCLFHPGFADLAHHLKAIDGIEKSFGQCCKENKDVQACAEGKWKKMVDWFCKEEKKVKVNRFECCKKQRGEERYDCFSTAAPDQNYTRRSDYNHVDEPPSLNMLCDTNTALKGLPVTVDQLPGKCCLLVAEKRAACLQLELDNLFDDACKTDSSLLAQGKQHCCEKTAKGRSECFTKLLLRNLAKAKQYNNRRKCPIML